MKYYRLKHPFLGLHYFKVQEKIGEDYSDVIRVTFGNGKIKKGRPYNPGITLSRYSTFIANYAWQKDKPERKLFISEISKEEYEKAYKLLLKKLK